MNGTKSNVGKSSMLRAAFCLFCVFVFSACVRYVPSREELNRPYGVDPAKDYVGPEAFKSYDVEQETRLTELIRERIDLGERLKADRYRIGPGDELGVTVQNFTEASKVVRVDPNGEIALPFVGQIPLAGNTAEQAARVIAAKVADYVVNPQVDVSIANYGAYKAYVSGAVKGEGGVIPLKKPQVSLLELLAGVADLQPGSGGVIYLYPSGALKESDPAAINQIIPPARNYDPSAKMQIDIERLYGGLEKRPLYIPIMDGDLIVVPPAPRIQVFGEVTKRGAQTLEAKPFLLSALAAAGGLTFGADIKSVEIFRELQFGKKAVLTLDLEQHVLRGAEDIRLRDGDIVWVPSHPTRYYREHAVSWLNAILFPVNMLSQQD